MAVAPATFETARRNLIVALRLRAPADDIFRDRVEAARTELDRRGATISADTLDAVLYLAEDLGYDLQDGLDDALTLLSRGSAVAVWPHLSTEVRQTLETLSAGEPLDLLARLMVDFAVQYSA